MNILVFGATGLVGCHLVEVLKTDHRIYAAVRDKSVTPFFSNKNLTIIELDLTDFDLNILPKDVDAIYYLAQSRRFREFPEGSEDVLCVNIIAPVKIVNWAIKGKVKQFIYASSGGVYTNPVQPVKEFFEINANEKLGFYLHSKLSAEMLLRCYARMFKSFVILRPFFIYGPGQHPSMLIPRLIQSIISGNQITLNGVEGIKINPIFVTDAAKAIMNALSLVGEYTINVAGKDITSIKQLCLLIGSIIGKEPHFKYEEKKENDLIADIALMKELLYDPITSLEDGIRETINKWG